MFHGFSTREVIEYLVHVERICKTWVSVGSGSGLLEKEIERWFPQKDLFCVDPDPYDYDEFVIRNPEYATTKELVVERPKIRGWCGMMLIWPYPNGEKNQGWDLEAIHLLKPAWILLLIEDLGASGSDRLFQWRKDQQKYHLTGQIVLSDYSAATDLLFGDGDVLKVLELYVRKTLRVPDSFFGYKVSERRRREDD